MGFSSWIQERLPISGDSFKELTNEPVPNHLKHWWFCIGGTPAYLFIVQIITGIMLAMYYKAAPETAYESVAYITNEANYGWFIRSMHKWSGTLMIAAMVLHQMRVFFTGAYRKPRELNWIVGMLLLIVTLLTGFTGYSLVFEQLSYWGATVGANISDNVPVIGGFLKNMLLAGDTYNANTLSRFFILHAAVFPVSIILLLIAHLSMVRVQGVTEYKFKGEENDEKTHFNFFPDHLLTELGIGLFLMVLISSLAVALPAEMGAIANPLATPEVIKPEWFFYVAFRWLKLFTGSTAVITQGLVVAVMMAWPFIDGAIRRRRPNSEFSVWVGVLAVLAIIGLTVWEAAVAH